MKLSKYLLAVILALAIVASALHYKRETIARNIANSALQGKGLVATDLSIDTLGTDRAVLSRLTLVQDSGARYELRGIAFPLSFPSLKAETITIDALHVVPATNDGEPLEFAALVQTFLGLAQSVPNTTIVLGRLSAGELPEVTNLLWRSSGENQQLAFSLQSIDVTVDVVPGAQGKHLATVKAATGGDRDALNLSLAVEPGESGFAAEGNASIHVLPWLPMLHSLGLVPERISTLDATLDGPLSLQIEDGGTQAVSLSGELAIGGARSTRYEFSGSDPITVQLGDGASLELAASYPDAEWTAQVESANFVLSSRFADDAKGRIAELSCHRGVECRMLLAFDDVVSDVAGTGKVTANFASLLSVTLGDVTQIEFLPDTSLRLSGLQTGPAGISDVSVHRLDGAKLTVDDNGWSADIANAQLGIRGLAMGDTLLADLPLSLRSIHVQDDGSLLRFAYAMEAGAASVWWNSAKMPAPGIDGSLELAGGELKTTFELKDNSASLSARVTAKHVLASGAGNAEIRDASLRFEQRNLSAWYPDWPYAWDIVAGDWRASADIAWMPSADGQALSATLSQQFAGLAGHYEDIAFAGLESALDTTLDADGSLRFAPATVSVALIDVGIPIENLNAEVELQAASRTAAVHKLEMSALGGKIVADPFVYAPEQPPNNILLRPQSIQLQFMVDLAEFDDIELTGSISGSVPVTVGEKAITVTDGRLESDAGGGVIRYGSAAMSGSQDSGIKVVSRALGNFQYDSLTSDVSYTEAGDLKLKMRLSGINPDMDPLQPVILNLGVENNIPQLLRSLQATRGIEDVLQRQNLN